MPHEISVFLEELLKAIIAAAVPVLAGYVFVLIKNVVKDIRSRLDVQQLFLIDNLVGMVVRAAEQAGIAKLISDTGEAKKQYAIAALQAAFESRGIKISVAEIEARIEEAIRLGIEKVKDDEDKGGDDEGTDEGHFGLPTKRK